MSRKWLSTGFRELTIGLSSACENELERELIFGFFLLGLLLGVGERGGLFVVGDIGVEAVSDKGLLFLSFVSMHGELCVEVLARGSPVI